MILSGIRSILIINMPQSLPLFLRLPGGASAWGLDLSDAEHPDPGGLAQTFLVGAAFVGESASSPILGENIFYGDDALMNRGDSDCRGGH